MIAKVRLQGTVNNTVSDQFHQARKAGNGESFWRGVAGGVADVLIVAHREKIAAGLRRAGFEIGDDDVLSEAVIVAMVAKKTEIDISSFDGEEISQKVMQYLSKIISEKIGVSVDLSLGYEAMLDAAAKSAIASGRVNQLIGEGIAARVKTAAAVQAAGLSKEDYKRYRDAKNSKKWREGKSFQWVAR